MRVALLVFLYYIKRNKGGTLLALIAALLLVFIQLQFGIFRKDYSLRIGMVGTYQEHDLPQEVARLISKPLVSALLDGSMEPELLGGWDINNDATEFRFKLKDGLLWSDGSPIKLSEININIPNTEVSFSDEGIIQFKLKEPYSPLPSLLTKPIFKKGSLLGTGPYSVSKVEKSRIFITKITLIPASSDLPTVYIRFYPSEKVAVAGLNLGEVQALLGVTNPNVFEDNPQIEILRKTDFGKIVTLLYNTTDPALSNRSLRQALSFQASIVEGEEVANNPYPPNSWAKDPDAKKFLSNTDEASSALERAKSSLPQEKLKGEFNLTTIPNLERVGEKIISSWKELGLHVNLRTEAGIPQNFQILLITQSIPQDPDQYFLWHSSQGKTNLSKYDSKRVDKDLEDGRKLIPKDERRSKYFDFQKTLLEDAPATFLYFPKYNIVYLKKVESLLDKILEIQNIN